MFKRHNPETVVGAFRGGYSQAIGIGLNKRWLFTAGPVGVAPDGAAAKGFGVQVDQT